MSVCNGLPGFGRSTGIDVSSGMGFVKNSLDDGFHGSWARV
jgi:hypothetical protein